MCSYHLAKISKIWIFYCAQWKNSNFQNFCWMITTQPQPVLKLFLLYTLSHRDLEQFRSLWLSLRILKKLWSPTKKPKSILDSLLIHKHAPSLKIEKLVLPATSRFLKFILDLFWFCLLKLVYSWTKSRKKNIWVFFSLILCHDLNFGIKKMEELEGESQNLRLG